MVEILGVRTRGGGAPIRFLAAPICVATGVSLGIRRLRHNATGTV
jgi:hypothetical protein